MKKEKIFECDQCKSYKFYFTVDAEMICAKCGQMYQPAGRGQMAQKHYGSFSSMSERTYKVVRDPIWHFGEFYEQSNEIA